MYSSALTVNGIQFQMPSGLTIKIQFEMVLLVEKFYVFRILIFLHWADCIDNEGIPVAVRIMIARFLNTSDLSGRNQDQTSLLRLIDRARQWAYLNILWLLPST